MEKPPKNNPDIVWVLSDRQWAGIGTAVILFAVIATVGSCAARNANNNIPVQAPANTPAQILASEALTYLKTPS